MKLRIFKLCTAALVGYAAMTAAMKATASTSPPRPSQMRQVNWAPVGAQTRKPIGWHNLCQVQPDECNSGQQRPVNVELTSEAKHQLQVVTTLANHVIDAQTDEEHFHLSRTKLIDWWTYPDDGAGDCSDYMMLKRKMLIEAGWPRSALLATVVIDHHGEGHAILTVTTDQGDFVLDNLTDQVVRWDKTGYAYVKRQSQENENVWVAIADGADAGAVSATNSLPVVKISSR